jgi:type I restriction enzyme M protein
MSKIQEILKNSTHSIGLFNNDEIEAIENLIIQNLNKNGNLQFKIVCLIRQKEVVLKPEEVIRQLYCYRLLNSYNYPKKYIELEKTVRFGRDDTKRADIVVFREDLLTPKIVIEVKAPDQTNDLGQLKSYLNSEGAEIGVATNGSIQTILYRNYPNNFEDTLSDIPGYNQEVSDVRQKKLRVKDLEPPQDLKQVVLDLENLVLANSGVDSFEEIFKLIYTKLYDEDQGMHDREGNILEFKQAASGNPLDTQKIIEKLFEEAKKEYKKVFEVTDKIKLPATTLSTCVGAMQKMKLFYADLQIMDEAFEYLLTAVAKGTKGQYFTPRPVIDMCVKMLNPKKNEMIIDTACGSAGFLLHTMKYVWKTNRLRDRQIKYAAERLFGMDFDEKSVKIARALMRIAGDGKTHIFKANSLESNTWGDDLRGAFGGEGMLREFENYSDREANEKSWSYFDFDVLLANPPFAGDINPDKIISTKFELAKDSKGKTRTKMSRHILFIEQNLRFVRPGGRLALVLPQGIFNNSSEKYVRDFIKEKARILAVVGIHPDSFKPHTGTKTSVIFLQTWNENGQQGDAYYNPKTEDYSIFFATQKLSFKDKSGEYIYVKDDSGEILRDGDNHKVYRQDLDKIAEAFVEFGRKEKLSFL